jgi:Rrf2 family protein
LGVSQKCQYALRGLFELARRADRSPVAIGEIAAAQAIPARFLEQIFAELRKAGYVASRRGASGGYILLADPAYLTVGEVIRLFEGPLAPVDCTGAGGGECSLKGACVFEELWDKGRRAIEGVYDSTTFEDLVEADRIAASDKVVNWHI